MDKWRKERKTQANITEKNSQIHFAHEQTRLKKSFQVTFLKLLLEQERHVYNKYTNFVTSTASTSLTNMHVPGRHKTLRQAPNVALHSQHNS